MKWQEGYSKRHNETRRERYKNDPEYRALQLERRRNNYRSKVPMKQRQILSDDDITMISLECFDRFKPKQMSEALGYSMSTIKRWITSGMLPNMIDNCYNCNEVIAIANCLRNREITVFSKNDVKLISKISREVNKVRKVK